MMMEKKKMSKKKIRLATRIEARNEVLVHTLRVRAV
jgi:hypothetical protein